MFRIYLKIAYRNIITRKFYTFLNISGLALAISCCILIYLYIGYNLSFDTYHKNPGRTFRLVHELHLDKTEYDRGTSYAEYQYMKTNVPQVQKAAFMIERQSFIVSIAGNNNKRFKEENTVAFTNSEWFNIFSYKWLSGSPASLNVPGNVVLSQRTAHKYFGEVSPIGKTLAFDGHPVIVAGLVADGPYNSDIRSDIFVSFSSLTTLSPPYGSDKYFLKDWNDSGTKYAGFVVLKNASDQAAVEKQLKAVTHKMFGKDAKIFDFTLLPLKEVHFDTRYGGVVQKSLLWTLFGIGVLIIAIAVINYINIVVAQQTKRSVEIGTRKVLGGTAVQIFMQFITESLVTSVIAVIAAVVMVAMVLPAANSWLFTDQPVYILSYTNLFLYTSILLFIITISTGTYPAWLLSRVSIAGALKNNVMNLPAGIGRKVLVVFQNTVTQALIVCTIIIVLQVNLLRNTDVGFNRKMVVTMPVGQVTTSQKYQLTQKLKQIPGVQSLSFCLNAPSSNSMRGATVLFNNRPNWEKWPARYALGDSAYCRTFGLTIIAGRNMRGAQAVPEFLINEKMAAMLLGRQKEAVVGKKLSAGDVKGVIVGVVKDFNVNSLVKDIEPSVILEDSTLQTNMAVKLSGDNLHATLNTVQQEYERVLPDQVFSYQFIDDQIAALYKKENIQQKLIWLAAVIAIVISSLGLLGLVSLVALQRTKEIGIRKILGASVSQICLMLSNDFMWMVLLAFVIAAPLSVWAMNQWLQSFAYRVQIQWWIFASAGGVAFIIAMISVGFQAIKAAIANPVKSLRNE
jgi:putative ABC transport system permease protein